MTRPVPAARREAPTPRLDGRTILVVEDNADTRHVLKFMLEIEGARVETAESGQEALARAQAFRPQVVLCDIGLPGFDGFEVARRVRQLPGMEGVLLVAISGYAGEDDLRRGREAGFDHHLAKPADPSAIQKMLAARSA